MKFTEHGSGLYVYDSAARTKNTTSESVNAYTMVSTVAEQKKMFSSDRSMLQMQHVSCTARVGRPSEAKVLLNLTKNLIRNCPVTPDDARRACHISGPNIPPSRARPPDPQPPQEHLHLRLYHRHPPITAHRSKRDLMRRFLFRAGHWFHPHNFAWHRLQNR
jgi:hypothetical protein